MSDARSKFLKTSPATSTVGGLNQGSFDRTFEIARSAVTGYLSEFLSSTGKYRQLALGISKVPIMYSTEPLEESDAQKIVIERFSETLKEHVPCVIIMSDGSFEHKTSGLGGVSSGFYHPGFNKVLSSIGGEIEINLTLMVVGQGQQDRNQLQEFISKALIDLMPYTSRFILYPNITDQLGSWQVVLPMTLSWSLDEGENRGDDPRQRLYSATTALRLIVSDTVWMDQGLPISVKGATTLSIEPIIPETLKVSGPAVKIQWGYAIAGAESSDVGLDLDSRAAPASHHHDPSSLRVRADHGSVFKVSDARFIWYDKDLSTLRARRPGTVEVYWYKRGELVKTYEVTITS